MQSKGTAGGLDSPDVADSLACPTHAGSSGSRFIVETDPIRLARIGE
jgi:hypothetical protein